MASREDFVIVVFVVASLPIAYAVENVTGQFELGMLALLTTGVIVPTIINEYERTRRNDT
ncbi:hypothetical protein ACFQJC_11480 [Haloferax namakaokahaiae]|uniref:Uncharacterized protein n=1 Tax=Haloferax namakaokahaiae TaxID=1748331 RepID=A0ABD5ZFV2_9EURY